MRNKLSQGIEQNVRTKIMDGLLAAPLLDLFNQSTNHQAQDLFKTSVTSWNEALTKPDSIPKLAAGASYAQKESWQCLTGIP